MLLLLEEIFIVMLKFIFFIENPLTFFRTTDKKNRNPCGFEFFPFLSFKEPLFNVTNKDSKHFLNLINEVFMQKKLKIRLQINGLK